MLDARRTWADRFAARDLLLGHRVRHDVARSHRPPGGGPPPHSHTREDESFYVLDGQLEIRAAGHTYDVKAGDFVHIPTGTVHYFRNTGLHAVKQLIIFTPAGLGEFFLEAGIEAQPGVSVPRSTRPTTCVPTRSPPRSAPPRSQKNPPSGSPSQDTRSRRRGPQERHRKFGVVACWK